MDPHTAAATTDTIPRASLESMYIGLETITGATEDVYFDDVRLALQDASLDRPGPVRRSAMVSTTRDVLADLRRLGLIQLEGPLPRPGQVVQKPCLCRPTAFGVDLACEFQRDWGTGCDALFSLWYQFHPHFAAMIGRLERGPFYLPEFSGVKQLGAELLRETDATRFAEGVAAKTLAKLPTQISGEHSYERLREEVLSRARDLHMRTALETVLDPQQVVEKIQDIVVAPAIIACEGLEFDRVSLKHILRAARDFYACGSTTMLNDSDARVHFMTCHLEPDSAGKVRIVHHGAHYVKEQFGAAMERSYQRLGGGGQWVNAFILRAHVCVDLGIPQEVFNQCLDAYVQTRSGAVRTELLFQSEPPGEPSITVCGKQIGLIQLIM